MVKTHLPIQVDIRDLGLIPGSGRSPGGGRDNPFQYSYLENLMDREAWRPTVHGVSKSWTQLKQLSMHIHIYIHVYTHIYTYIYTCIYIDTYIYIYIHMYIHLHIYRNINLNPFAVHLKLTHCCISTIFHFKKS